MENTDLQKHIQRAGWQPVNPGFWPAIVKDQINIVFLAPPLDTIPSPSGNAIYTIVQDLALRAPKPTLVLAIWPPKNAPEVCEISDRILYIKRASKSLFMEGHLPYKFKKRIWGTGRPELLHYAIQAAHLCNIVGPDLIVVEDVPLFGYTLRKHLKNSPNLILHQHNNAPSSYPTSWWNRMKKAYQGFVFVAHNTLKETELLHGPLKNASVVYNGVDLNHYDPLAWDNEVNILRKKYNIIEDETVVLNIGRIIPGKGSLELVKAFQKANGEKTRLFIIGDIEKQSDQHAEYIQQLQRISLASGGKVILTGRIPQETLPVWYQLGDLLVVPSIQPEGLPKVITEALAMGTPVLASDRGGTLELIRPGENGWLLENPQDINEFAQRLQSILSNAKTIEQFSKNAITIDRPNLSIEQSAKNFYNSIFI